MEEAQSSFYQHKHRKYPKMSGAHHHRDKARDMNHLRKHQEDDGGVGPRINQISNEIVELKSRFKDVNALTSKKFRRTKVYDILPGYSVHKYQCYPDLSLLR